MAESEDTELSATELRDVKLKRRFLDGTLSIGSSMRLVRMNNRVSFTLQGHTRKKLNAWWEKKLVHTSHRMVNVQLIVHKEPLPVDYQLVRDISRRKAPLTHVQIQVTPASHTSILGKDKKTSSMVDFKSIPGAPSFLLQDIAGKESDLNLIQFILDTVSYHEEKERKAANVRPFITPRKDLTPLPRHLLPKIEDSLTWTQQHLRDEEEQGDLLFEAYEEAWRLNAGQKSKKDIFNDDVNRSEAETVANASHYHPAILLSSFSLGPEAEPSFQHTPDMTISMTTHSLP